MVPIFSWIPLLAIIAVIIATHDAHSETNPAYTYALRASVVGVVLEVDGYPLKQCRSQTYLVSTKGDIVADATEPACGLDQGVVKVLKLRGCFYSALQYWDVGKIVFEPNREQVVTQKELNALVGRIRMVLEDGMKNVEGCREQKDS